MEIALGAAVMLKIPAWQATFNAVLADMNGQTPITWTNGNNLTLQIIAETPK